MSDNYCPICYEDKKLFCFCYSCENEICKTCFSEICEKLDSLCPFCREEFIISDDENSDESSDDNHSITIPLIRNDYYDERGDIPSSCVICIGIVIVLFLFTSLSIVEVVRAIKHT